MRYMLLYEGHRLEVTEMSILEYTFEEFLEDTKQEQLEKEELRLQLEKERRESLEKDVIIQNERKDYLCGFPQLLSTAAYQIRRGKACKHIGKCNVAERACTLCSIMYKNFSLLFY